MKTPRTFVVAGLAALSLSAAIAAVSAAASSPRPSPAAGEPTLDEVRQATERFRDVNVALAEGYIRDPNNLCDTAPMMGRPASLGAMGIHYFRPDLLGSPRRPRRASTAQGRTPTSVSRPS